KGERDATEHQNEDRGREEPHPLGGDTVGVFRLILGRSTATAAAGSHDHEAQPGLLPARCVALGRAGFWHARRTRCEQQKCWYGALKRSTDQPVFGLLFCLEFHGIYLYSACHASTLDTHQARHTTSSNAQRTGRGRE